MLGGGQLPEELVSVLSARFQVLGEYGGAMSTERCSVQPLHAFLGHLVSRPDPFPGTLLVVDQDRTLHLLYLMLSVPFGLYSLDRRLFAFCGELPREGLLPVVDLYIDALGVWCTVCAVPRVDHFIHLEEVPPSDW